MVKVKEKRIEKGMGQEREERERGNLLGKG